MYAHLVFGSSSAQWGWFFVWSGLVARGLGETMTSLAGRTGPPEFARTLLTVGPMVTVAGVAQALAGAFLCLPVLGALRTDAVAYAEEVEAVDSGMRIGGSGGPGRRVGGLKVYTLSASYRDDGGELHRTQESCLRPARGRQVLFDPGMPTAARILAAYPGRIEVDDGGRVEARDPLALAMIQPALAALAAAWVLGG